MELPGEDVVVRSVESMLDGRETRTRRCLNCEAELVGPYCSACGQKAGDLHVGVLDFLKEAMDNLFSFDSRLWRSLRPLLAKPGFLTVEYWEGRRARYVPPLRLYLFISFLTFLTLSLVSSEQVVDTQAGSDSRALIQLGASRDGEPIDWEETAGETGPLRWLALNVIRPMVEQPERTADLFFQRLPWGIFLLVPFFAVLLRVFFRKKERYFVPHLIFSLHFHSATFLYLLVAEVLDSLTGTEIPSGIAALVILVSLYLGLRRAYGQGRLKTFLKTAAALWVHLFAIGLTLLVIVMLTGISM